MVDGAASPQNPWTDFGKAVLFLHDDRVRAVALNMVPNFAIELSGRIESGIIYSLYVLLDQLIKTTVSIIQSPVDVHYLIYMLSSMMKISSS
jgi:hypothetical protein